MRKYSLAVFLAVFIFAFLPSMQVQAEGSDGFELDGTGTVTLRSQHAAKEEISSLQFSLTVDSAEAAQVEFEFGQNNARIAEFRYDENAKQLNIYMAGVDALFAENTEALTIGKIILRDNSGNAVDGTVSVVENSLQYVYGEELKPMESVEVPGAVLIGPSAQNPPPEQTPQPGVTPQPEQTPPAAEETPAPDDTDTDTDDDPNADWNPGWEDTDDNSQSSGSSKKPQTSAKVPGRGTGKATPKPSATPQTSASPSPEPDASEPVTEPEESLDEPEASDEDSIISAAGSGEEPGNEDAGEMASKEKADWIIISVVVIAIVIFVGVAVMAVVVLKGKKRS